MLPLWIIDLNRDEGRRVRLQELLMSLQDTSIRDAEYKNASDLDDILEELNEREIAESANPIRLVDTLWHYSDCLDISFEEESWVGSFVDYLVNEGQSFVHKVYASSPTNECCMNVCVLGNSTELSSLKLFSSVAAIVKREKGKIVPDHIHQGINIVGMLFVPSDINARPFSERQDTLRCLKELNVQHQVKAVSGYDKVMLYQDTQHRTEKLYPLLDKQQQMDFVFQCLLHLYYACDSTHPLIDGTNNSEDFFFTMGAASLYYDTREQDCKDIVDLLKGLLKTFKEEPTSESETVNLSLMGNVDISPYEVVDALDIGGNLPDTDKLIESPSPYHPVKNFQAKLLKRNFYQGWLKRFPYEFLNSIIKNIAFSTKETLLKINEGMDKKFRFIVDKLFPIQIKGFIEKECSLDKGGVRLIRNKFEELQGNLADYKDDLKSNMDKYYWEPRINRIHEEHEELYDSFVDYHDAYVSDTRESQTNHRDDIKRNAMNRLVEHLKKGTPILARMVRAFLLGVSLTMSVMLIIELLYANFNFENLTFVPQHFDFIPNENPFIFIYALIIFLIPGLWQLISYYLYKRRLHKLQNDLIACYLHDAYEKQGNRIQNQVTDFYNKLIEYCKAYKLRCDQVLNDNSLFDHYKCFDVEIEETMFNQPLIGGKCNLKNVDGHLEEKEFFPNYSIIANEVKLGDQKIGICSINPEQQYQLIQENADSIFQLFTKVNIYPLVGPERLTREEIDQNVEDDWSMAKNMFASCSVKSFYHYILPRRDGTVGEKLNIYRKDLKNRNGFELLVHFAAPNGEFSANDDKEFADLKSNSEFLSWPNAFGMYLPAFSTVYQVINKSELFDCYLFLTRWKTFDSISYNRILPETELNEEVLKDENVPVPDSTQILFSLLGGHPSIFWYELITSVRMGHLDEMKIYQQCQDIWKLNR